MKTYTVEEFDLHVRPCWWIEDIADLMAKNGKRRINVLDILNHKEIIHKDALYVGIYLVSNEMCMWLVSKCLDNIHFELLSENAAIEVDEVFDSYECLKKYKCPHKDEEFIEDIYEEFREDIYEEFREDIYGVIFNIEKEFYNFRINNPLFMQKPREWLRKEIIRSYK